VADSAYQAALKILSRRDYFRDELAERLARKGFQPEEIEGALDRCSEIDLLDDDRVARRFVELRAATRGWGPRRLEAELRKRGVGEELASTASRIDPETVAEALQTALRRAELRAQEGWWRLPERRARMVSSLIARGFEASDAISAVDELVAVRERTDRLPGDQ
jgi:regulatory protein